MGLLLTILLVLLILGLLSGPVRGVSYGGPINLLGLILVIVVIAALVGSI